MHRTIRQKSNHEKLPKSKGDCSIRVYQVYKTHYQNILSQVPRNMVELLGYNELVWYQYTNTCTIFGLKLMFCQNTICDSFEKTRLQHTISNLRFHQKWIADTGSCGSLSQASVSLEWCFSTIGSLALVFRGPLQP